MKTRDEKTYGMGLMELTAPCERELRKFQVEHPEEYLKLLAWMFEIRALEKEGK